jgi:CubicO group peptidase (beta-lactamase class C family)
VKINLFFLLLILVLTNISNTGYAASSASKELLDFTFKNEKGSYTSDELYVMKGDEVLLEEYRRGYKADTRHYAWSISKTISGTLIGAAVQRGDLSLQDPIEKYLGPIGYQDLFDKDPNLKKITVEHVMEWGTGFNYSEEYEHAESRTDSSVIQQLYSKLSSQDSIRYILSHKVEKEPGTHFRYTTGDSTVLMGVLKGVYKNNQKNFPWDILFNELDMKEITFEADLKGTYVGGAFAYVTARDLAKIGRLYLNDGLHKGKQLLPPDWSSYTWAMSKTYKNTDKSKIGMGFNMPGRQWWLNRDRKDPSKAKYPQAPKDTFFGIGHWGQYLIVIPSKNIVAVRFGEDKAAGIPVGDLVAHIVKFVDSFQAESKGVR